MLTDSAYPFLVIIIFVIGLALRLFRIKSVPGVYPDEANFIEMSWNLLHVKFQWGCFSHSFLPRLPLPFLCMGAAQAILGRNLFAIRIITALVGATGILLIGFLHPHRQMRPLLLVAAGLYALFPFAVCYQRWGFTYTYLIPVMLGTLWLRLRLHRDSALKLWFAYAGMLGAALLIEPIGIGVAVYGWLSLWPRYRHRLLWVFPLSWLPLLAYLLFLLIRIPEVFISDMATIMQEHFPETSLPEPGIVMTIKGIGAALGILLPLGAIGIFLLPRRIRRHLFFLGIIHVFLFVVLSAFDLSLLAREAILLVPVLCLGTTPASRSMRLWFGPHNPDEGDRLLPPLIAKALTQNG